MPDRPQDDRLSNPIGREVAKLTCRPTLDILEERERLRKQMWGALAMPNALEQVAAAMEQHRLEQVDQLSQVRKLFEQPSALAQIRAAMEQQRVQQHEAFVETESLFKSPGLTAMREAMTSFDRLSQPLGAMIKQLRLPVHDAAGDALRALYEPGESIREMVDRMYAPSMARAIEEMSRAARPTADLFAGLDASTREIREFFERTSLDAEVGLRAFEAVDRQLEVVEGVLEHEPGEASPHRVVAGQPGRSLLSLSDWLVIMQALLAIAAVLVSYEGMRLQKQSLRQDAQLSADDAVYRKRMLALMERLADQASRAAKAQPRILAVGLRPVTVRSLPGNGDRIGTVHPNQIVEQTGHERRWIKVRYRDHLEERDVEGWVLKHRLRIVPAHK